MTKIIPFLFLPFLPAILSAQLLSGRVVTEEGDPAAKVKVHSSKSAETATTDKDGRFKIMVKSPDDTLVFSSPIFEPYKIQLTESITRDPKFEVVLLTKRTYTAKINPYDYYKAAPAMDSLTKGAGSVEGFFGAASKVGFKEMPVSKLDPAIDKDQDGVANEEDKCPDAPGFTRYQGCPIPDTDKDGVDDEDDKCITEPGATSNFGCPVIPEAIIQKINLSATSVRFAPGSTKVLAKPRFSMKTSTRKTKRGYSKGRKDGGYDFDKYYSSSTSTSTYSPPPPATYSSGYSSRSPHLNGKILRLDDDSIPHFEDSLMYKAQLLTAGEVNDFYKWKMWEDLSAYEFAEYSRKWDMKATKRYTVQLQNKNFTALVNQPVYLVNKKTNEEVWSAVTDNTGKAELWADLVAIDGLKIDSADYFIRDGEGNTIETAQRFENGVNQLLVDKPCTVSNAVDIAFVMDATGSMGDELRYLKFELEDVIRKTFRTYSDLDMKAAAVFYRDLKDDYVTTAIDFQSQLLKVVNFIKLQRADQGGDEPEAVDSALDVALNKLSWRKEARARLLFLVLDAAPHDYAKEKIQAMIAKAAAMGIRIIPVACSGSSKNNEYLLRTMALATNGTYIFLTDESGIGASHTIASTDNYTVELMNSLMQRVIQQFVYVRSCDEPQAKTQREPLIRQPKNIAKLKVFPNPTSGNLTIESNVELKEVYVTDFTGKILMKLTAQTKGSWSVNIANYPSGPYLIKYITADHTLGTEKIILIH